MKKTVKNQKEAKKITNIEANSNPSALKIYQNRFARLHDELRWLYMELYDNGSMFGTV